MKPKQKKPSKKPGIQVIPTEKCILRVWVKKDPDSDKINIDWDFPEKIKIFTLVGIMETIKADLIECTYDTEDEEE